MLRKQFKKLKHDIESINGRMSACNLIQGKRYLIHFRKGNGWNWNTEVAEFCYIVDYDYGQIAYYFYKDKMPKRIVLEESEFAQGWWVEREVRC